ncbi:MAG TPA: helicase HerA-like domain-containing protein [Polyangiaceae bacterium]|nr:helicase HerA-like domain-containing protein [Polyangiaceae bacterium]
MTLHHFTVSQVRTAAICPRIHYFDVVRARQQGWATPKSTLVWSTGSEAQAGGGALFHRVIEKFNRRAAHAPEIQLALETSEGVEPLKQAFLRFANTQCIDLRKLATRSVALRQTLISTLQAYFAELAEMVNYALSRNTTAKEVKEQIFGDRRQRVDVTFRVGDGHEAHVTGAVDYVFYDWRISGHRIIDYKLIPADHPNKDLFQVFAYALMHHHQHGTQPAACVFYLYPKRHLLERKWPDVYAERHKVYTHLASMVGWSTYDETTQTGLKPRGNPAWCAGCKWNRGGECERRLGPKLDGEYDKRWEELGQKAPTPEVTVYSPLALPVAETWPSDAELDSELDAQLDEIEAPSSAPSPAPPLPAGKPGSAPIATTQAPNSAVEPGLFLGRSKDGSPVVLPVNTINTHVAIVGAAGSGKTWAAKCLVEEVVRAGVPVVAIDPQGDLVQFLRAREAEQFQNGDQERYAEYRERVETRIWTPGTSHGARLCLDPIRLPSDADLARIERPERRREESDSMLQAVAANLVSLAKVGGEEDSQRTFLYLLLGALRQAPSLTLRDVVDAISHVDEVPLPHEPDHVLKKIEREKLARKLNTFVVGPGKNLFSEGTPLDLDAFVRPTTPGKTPLNVIYLNALTDDDQKHFFLAALAAEIYRWMVTSLDATTGRPNLLFYLDEARDYIPAGGRKPAAKDPLIRLFTQGRKYGVGCLLCTQSPRSVDYNVFGNCSTKIVGRMEAEQDIERIAEWFTTTGAKPAWVAARKGADKGTFVARYPEMPEVIEGKVFTSRLLYSLHEGAWSPDRVERELELARNKG